MKIKKSICTIIIVSAAAILGCKSGPFIMHTDQQLDEYKVNLLELHNDFRKNNNLNALTSNDKLNNTAQQYAENMADRDTLSHYGPKWSTVTDRVKKNDYHYSLIGENIASGQKSPEEVMDGWIKSFTHKTNILGRYKEIGIGVAKSSRGRLYWCVVFGELLRP